MSMTSDRTAEFLELSRLDELRIVGWSFHPVFNRHQQLTEVRGVRTWPDGSADALLVRYISDAAAVRVDPAGSLTWQYDGGLVEVIDALLTLPVPGSADAPHLVLGAAPQLWTPAPRDRVTQPVL